MLAEKSIREIGNLKSRIQKDYLLQIKLMKLSGTRKLS